MQLAARRPERIEHLVMAQAPNWQGELDWFSSFWLSGNGLLKTPHIGQRFLAKLHLGAPSVWLRPWFRLTVPEPEDRRRFRETTMAATKLGMVNCWSSIYQAWHAVPVPELGGVY